MEDKGVTAEQILAEIGIDIERQAKNVSYDCERSSGVLSQRFLE